MKLLLKFSYTQCWVLWNFNLFTSLNSHQHLFFQTVSIKLITCSSELCSAHGNKTICFKVFSEEAELGNHTYEIKKKYKRQINQASLPHKKQNKKKPLQQTKEKQALILSGQHRQLHSWHTHHQPHRCSPDWYISLTDMNNLFGSLICSLICYQFQLAVLKALRAMARECLGSAGVIAAEGPLTARLSRCLIPTTDLLLLQV